MSKRVKYLIGILFLVAGILGLIITPLVADAASDSSPIPLPSNSAASPTPGTSPSITPSLPPANGTADSNTSSPEPETASTENEIIIVEAEQLTFDSPSIWFIDLPFEIIKECINDNYKYSNTVYIHPPKEGEEENRLYIVSFGETKQEIRFVFEGKTYILNMYHGGFR